MTAPSDTRPATMTEGDFTALARFADEYDTLMELWRDARAGSQETADLHATFKARERDLGKLAETGFFSRVRASLASIPQTPKEGER